MATIYLRKYFVNSFFVYEYYCIFYQIDIHVEAKLRSFCIFDEIHIETETKIAIISHMSFSISFSHREITVFCLYKFTLRLKQGGHHIADDNF